ncbi:MAG: CDP-diacylglycerol--glycerol-3-phosphate 3-phosphatidyltransferase [Planctomycetia bacterium]|nr:CDP-diacylglycerol--glycerol-3-phosphate 3-phosphatidyltransferase [Planctomycetia bacterium]
MGPREGSAFNVPNLLTSLRLLLSIGLFVLIGWAQHAVVSKQLDNARWIYAVATVMFLIAAGTDWLDGYWARRYGQVTRLGRILDPFVDKVVICGTFIFLIASPGSEVAAWMAVVIVSREILVTALRGELEGMGKDFSANLAGKLKMVVQCAAAAVSLAALTIAPAGDVPEWIHLLLIGLMWGTVVITIYSGVGYIVAAIRMMRRA